MDLLIPGRFRAVRFAVLTASCAGRADSILPSGFTGRLRRGSRLIVAMGTGGSGVAREPIAETRHRGGGGHGTHPLIAVDVSRRRVSYGTPRGRILSNGQPAIFFRPILCADIIRAG